MARTPEILNREIIETKPVLTAELAELVRPVFSKIEDEVDIFTVAAAFKASYTKGIAENHPVVYQLPDVIELAENLGERERRQVSGVLAKVKRHYRFRTVGDLRKIDDLRMIQAVPGLGDVSVSWLMYIIGDKQDEWIQPNLL